MSDTPHIARGLEGVVVSETALSSVRGDVGNLIYCGYPIDELAGKATFEEVIHLLHRGHLPNAQELADLKKTLLAYRNLPDPVIDFIKSLPKDANPMHAIRTAISALGCFDETANDIDSESIRDKSLNLIASIPIITAYFHRNRLGLDLLPPDPDLSEAANFMYLIDGEKPNEEKEATMDMCFILHADHGFNASTFSARVTSSTLSDIYSAITSAIGTLRGPLHGGANEGVIHMLNEIGEPDKVDEYVYNCLKEKKKIMGIGHRVYKTLDPRAPHLKKMAILLSNKIGEPKWIQMSERIAEIMLKEKNLHANVDFYSATVYHSLGIPTDLFTPIFAIARTAGWTAQVIEQLADNRLIRPRANYIGPEGLTFKPIEER